MANTKSSGCGCQADRQGLIMMILGEVLAHILDVSQFAPLLAGGLLGYIGLRVARGAIGPEVTDGAYPPRPPVREAGFWIGLCTGITNPIIGAYFASQFLIADQTLSAWPTAAVALSGIGLLDGLRNLLVAIVFSSTSMQRAVLAREITIRRGLGSAFVGLALWGAWPSLAANPAIVATLPELTSRAMLLWHQMVDLLQTATALRLLVTAAGALAVYAWSAKRDAVSRKRRARQQSDNHRDQVTNSSITRIR